jgi:hypothetical protein
MIKASFGKNALKREFTNALIYSLQRNESFESNVDNASTSYQLLVIWRSDSRYEFSVGVLLIKHDNANTLDEDKIKELDYPPLTLLGNGRNIENSWRLDDTKVLITSKCEKRIRTIEITISKWTKANGCMTPLQVSSNM